MLIGRYAYIEVSLYEKYDIGAFKKYAYREVCLYGVCLYRGLTVLPSTLHEATRKKLCHSNNDD